MDKNIKIQLESTKNVNSTNVETYDKILLNNQRNKLLEYNIENVLSATEIFDNERQNTPIYRIYGGIEYLSILNGLTKNYLTLQSYFSGSTYEERLINPNNYKNIYNSFDFYLVKPTTGYTKILNTDEYIRQFEVIATPDNFELINAGFSKNIYGDQKYSFLFNKDFDVSSWVDEFGFPITEVYLFVLYNKTNNENTYRNDWSTTTGDVTQIPLPYERYNIGDVVYGDKIQYNKTEFLQEQIESQTYYIQTKYYDNIVENDFLYWEYNPFIPFKLRYFINELSRANTGGTSYDQTINIPSYATNLGDGNMVWRNFLEQGYIDPLTGDGVDYPFVNKRRYLFKNIILSVTPVLEYKTALNNTNTIRVFSEMKLDNPTLLNTKPLSELSNIGKPCQ